MQQQKTPYGRAARLRSSSPIHCALLVVLLTALSGTMVAQQVQVTRGAGAAGHKRWLKLAFYSPG